MGKNKELSPEDKFNADWELNKKFRLLSNEAMPISESHALEIQQRPEYAHYVRDIDNALVSPPRAPE